jgi:DNA replication protein DnaC
MRSDSPLSPDDLLTLVAGADVLVVDDIGAHGQGGTDWQRDVAWRLFESRVQLHATRQAVTIVTSNLAPDALEVALGQPVVSRICAVALPVSVAGEDARRAA